MCAAPSIVERSLVFRSESRSHSRSLFSASFSLSCLNSMSRDRGWSCRVRRMLKVGSAMAMERLSVGVPITPPDADRGSCSDDAEMHLCRAMERLSLSIATRSRLRFGDERARAALCAEMGVDVSRCLKPDLPVACEIDWRDCLRLRILSCKPCGTSSRSCSTEVLARKPTTGEVSTLRQEVEFLRRRDESRLYGCGDLSEADGQAAGSSKLRRIADVASCMLIGGLLIIVWGV